MKVDPTDIYIVNLIYDLLVSMIIKIITPNFSIRQRTFPSTFRLWTVENNGFEPLTPCLQSRCSSQLS